MIIASITRLTGSQGSFDQTFQTPILYIPDENSTVNLTTEGVTIAGDLQENNSAVVDVNIVNGVSLRSLNFVEGPID